MTLDGATFFQEFVPTFLRAKDTEYSTVWLYYQKLKADGERLHVKTSDWTPMMITFLDELAWRLGYMQLYERYMPGGFGGRRDILWVKAGNPARLVVIEPENDPESVYDSEIPKLVTDGAPLKILITYHGYGPNQLPSEWRKGFLTKARETIAGTQLSILPDEELEFLVILGDRVEERPEEWQGYSLRLHRGRWQSSWGELTTKAD